MIRAREQSSTSYPINFLMVDSTDHVTGKTGLSPTVTISKNGAAFASPSGAVTELSDGWYSLAGNATDRETLGELLIHASATGADPTDLAFCIVSFDPFADIAYILADTNELQTDDIPSTLTTMESKIDTVNSNVDSILADTGTDGVKLANDAITSASFDESTAFPIKSADIGATQIARVGADSDTLETLSDQIDGVEPADVWGYASRTLTQSAVSVAAAVTADSITVIRGDTANISLTDLGSLANNSKVYFTVKNREADADNVSMLMVEKTDGLKYINGMVAITSGNGTLVIDDESTGDITITVAAVEIAKLGLGSYLYDVQIVRSSGVPVTTLAKGSFIVTGDITRAIS